MILTDKDMAIARSCEFLHRDPWNVDWETNIHTIQAYMHAEGFTAVLKRKREPARNMSTTLTPLRQIRVSRKYETDASRATAAFAASMAHEMVHVRQRVSVVRYASTRYRFRVELPAYRETMRIRTAQEGLGKNARAELAHKLSDSLRSRYFIGLVDDRAHRAATDIMLEEARSL